jgi:hypothetical protein
MILSNFFFTGVWFYVGDGCFGAKGNSYMEVTYKGPSTFVGAMKLVHTSGYVSNRAPGNGSFWGSAEGGNRLATLITDSQDRIIHPSPRVAKVLANGAYDLPGFTSLSPEVVIGDFCAPQYLYKGIKLRVWYGEDWKDVSESDNHGMSCAKMFAYLSQ